MEVKEGQTPGITERGDEVPENYCVAPRTENSAQIPGPTMPATAAAPAPPAGASTPAPATGSELKKKRGRPRKYGPDGRVATAFSAMPISSSIPLTGEFSAWKRGRGRPVDTAKKSYKPEFDNIGDRLSYFVGANFTPHLVHVNAGEDVTMKIMAFSQQGSRAICILSAIGTVSNVTIRQSTSSGGTLTYEGHFEIVNLTGSFLPTEHGGTKSRCGGMSVTFAGPDGRVLGGGLAGLLIAASPVVLVVASFLPGHQQEQRHKRQRTEPAAVPVTPALVKPTAGTSPFSFQGDNQAGAAAASNAQQGHQNPAENQTPSPEDESKDQSTPNCELSS